MRRRSRFPGSYRLLVAAGVGFAAGVLATLLSVSALSRDDAIAETRAAAPGSAEVTEPRPSNRPAAAPSPRTDEHAVVAVSADSVADLRRRHLKVPVQDVDREDLRDTFNEKRRTRRHEALDVLAPRNTPVLAVEDGTIARLFLSKAGGITVYQFDPSKTYVYYYAHLERYAPGLKEGDRVEREQVLGFVGTTGNAPPDTPHLHFAIFRMTDEKKWWDGTAIDPYQVFK